MKDIDAEIDRAWQGDRTHTVALIECLRANDDRYWRMFVTRLAVLVRQCCAAEGFCPREHQWEELFSDVRFKILDVLKNYQPTKESLQVWLRNICRPVIRDYVLKQTRPKPTSDEHILASIPDPQIDDLLSRIADDEQRQRIRQTLLKVLDFSDPVTAEVFREYVLQGIPIDTVAANWQLSVTKVAAIRTQIIQRLRDQLAGDLDLEELLARRRTIAFPPRHPLWSTIGDSTRTIHERTSALTELVARREEGVAAFVLAQLEHPETAEEWLPSLLHAAEFADIPNAQNERLWQAIRRVVERLRTMDTPTATRSFATAMRCLGLRLPTSEFAFLVDLLTERKHLNAKFEMARRQAILQTIQTIFSASPPEQSPNVFALQQAIDSMFATRLNDAGFAAGPAASLTANALTTLACLVASDFEARATQFAQQAPAWLKPLVAQYLGDVLRRWQERHVPSEMCEPIRVAQQRLLATQGE